MNKPSIKFSSRLTAEAHHLLGELKKHFNNKPRNTKNHSMNSLISEAIIQLALQEGLLLNKD